MNDLHNKLKEDGKNIHLLESEKLAIKNRILAMPMSEPQHNSIFSFLQIFANPKFAIAAVFAIVLVSSISVTYASQKSVPGGVLHSLEINVIEEIQETFLFSGEAQITYSTDRIKERLMEMQDISGRKLTTGETSELAENLEKHVDNVFVEVPEDINKEGIEDLITVSALLHAHEDMLIETKNEQQVVTNLNKDITQQLSEQVEEYTESETPAELSSFITENTTETTTLISDNSQDPDTLIIQRHLDSAKKEIADGDLDSALEEAIDAKVEALAQEYAE